MFPVKKARGLTRPHTPPKGELEPVFNGVVFIDSTPYARRSFTLSAASTFPCQTPLTRDGGPPCTHIHNYAHAKRARPPPAPAPAAWLSECK